MYPVFCYKMSQHLVIDTQWICAYIRWNTSHRLLLDSCLAWLSLNPHLPPAADMKFSSHACNLNVNDAYCRNVDMKNVKHTNLRIGSPQNYKKTISHRLIERHAYKKPGKVHKTFLKVHTKTPLQHIPLNNCNRFVIKMLKRTAATSCWA